MSLLKEIAATTKREGMCTVDWATLQSGIPGDPRLRDVPGKNDFQKLKVWAERQALLMDYDVQLVSFMSEIRAVTFRDKYSTQYLLSKSTRGAPLAPRAP